MGGSGVGSTGVAYDASVGGSPLKEREVPSMASSTSTLADMLNSGGEQKREEEGGGGRKAAVSSDKGGGATRRGGGSQKSSYPQAV